jgi:hypothetical protein
VEYNLEGAWLQNKSDKGHRQAPKAGAEMSTPAMLKGVITGRTIELDQEPGFPQGQEVYVFIEPAQLEPNIQGKLPPGEGLRRAFGAWAEDAEELDKYLEWARQQRKIGRSPIEE